MDAQLRGPLQQRIQDVVDEYTKVARDFSGADEDLSPEQLGALLTAVDQGSGLMLLGGGTLDDHLLGLGMSRLLSVPSDDVESSGEDPPARRAKSAAGGPTGHVQERLMKAMRAKDSGTT